MTEDKPDFRANSGAILNETILKELKSVARWEREWGFQLQKYRQLQKETKRLNVFPDEAKSEEEIMVNHPKCPVTTSKQIGWLVNDPRFNLEKFGRQSKPIGSLDKKLGWPIEGCP
ncbi:hypothetical protein JTE90_003294 [Oedothorax gibbosus]|uniref:Uncharacterized protein n=1 Tax=Oedothorax gibbosus TaxID=931172 RepID=A0AAV6V5U6_9ARAC|nr:hypothetical protein JTE90_003294 [Oedothorax gibbosus]